MAEKNAEYRHPCEGCGKDIASAKETKCSECRVKNKEATLAIRTVIANLKAKFAELDVLDDEFADLDAITPEGENVEQFSLLSDKREELEDEIRSMRERVQLISEWEKFKGTGWSDDVQVELNALDQQFANIADGATDMGMDAPLPEMPVSPETPVSPSEEVPMEAEEPAMEAPVTDVNPNDEAVAPSEATPLVPPVASSKKINKKLNYELQDKKRSTVSDLKKGDTHMANQTTNKLSLKEKLAEVKMKRDAIEKEAKKRVASAWTIAKTMLPNAPTTVQKAFSASLLTNSTKVLNAALRQTAVNAHNTKLAETFKQVHKIELNDLLEDPSVLKAEKSAVSSELKGDPKSAATKIADDRKECGPQDGTYNDGLDGFGKEFDASKAGERPDAGEKPGQTVDLSDGKSASAKKACVGKDCTGCKNPDCKGKKATSKKADEVEESVEEVPAPEAEVEESVEEVPEALPPAMPENPEVEAAEILTDEKKEIIEEKIDEIQQAVNSLEAEIKEESDEPAPYEDLEEGGLDTPEDGSLEEEDIMMEEPMDDENTLDFAKVFDTNAMEEKAASLANEGEKEAAGEDDFFTPSAAGSLEASMDDDGMADMHDMFSMQGADGDPLASLIAGLKTAEQVAGMEVIPSMTGELANHFENDEADTDNRDNETDHTGDLWAETIEDITPEEQGAKRTKQDSTNELEKPKAATLKKIRTASGSDKTVRFDVGDALFGNDDE